METDTNLLVNTSLLAGDQNSFAVPALFQAAFEHSHIGMALIRADGCWLQVNRALSELFGYTEQELLAHGQTLVVPDEDGQDVPFLLNEQGEDRCSIKRHFQRRDGSQVWCRHSCTLVHGHGSHPAFFIVAIEDIGDQKAFEDAMQRLSLQYELILNSSGEGIAELDASGRIMFINVAGANMLGWPVEDLLGRMIEEVLCGVAGGCAGTVFRDAYREGISAGALESVFLHRDGTSFFASFSCTPILDDGRPTGAVLSFLDISRRKAAEDSLKKSHAEIRSAYERLAETQVHLLQSEKLASIGQLAAGVAHEINNPLGYVISNLGTLEEYTADIVQMLDAYEAAESLLGEHPEVLGRIRAIKGRIDLAYLKEDVCSLVAESRSGLDRVKHIVVNLKDFSRIDARDEWVWFDLHQCLDSTLSIIWNELKYKAKVSKEYGELPEVECLPSQINQVFLNMLVNAGHAIEEKGDIFIRTGREGDSVWVEFADTGKGIAAKHIDRIFDPFFTTKSVGKGTGLGLSISHNIISKHGGRIDVKSEEGKGTVFRVWIPVRRPGSVVEEVVS